MPNFDKLLIKSKGFSVINLIVIVVFIIGILILLQKAFIGPKRVCPDKWIIDRTNAAKGKDEYLIIEGKRADPEDYDLKWIREKCTVTNPEEAI